MGVLSLLAAALVGASVTLAAVRLGWSVGRKGNQEGNDAHDDGIMLPPPGSAASPPVGGRGGGGASTSGRNGSSTYGYANANENVSPSTKWRSKYVDGAPTVYAPGGPTATTFWGGGGSTNAQAERKGGGESGVSGLGPTPNVNLGLSVKDAMRAVEDEDLDERWA